MLRIARSPKRITDANASARLGFQIFTSVATVASSARVTAIFPSLLEIPFRLTEKKPAFAVIQVVSVPRMPTAHAPIMTHCFGVGMVLAAPSPFAPGDADEVTTGFDPTAEASTDDTGDGGV